MVAGRRVFPAMALWLVWLVWASLRPAGEEESLLVLQGQPIQHDKLAYVIRVKIALVRTPFVTHLFSSLS